MEQLEESPKRLWGGRFSKQHCLHVDLEAINRSIDIDSRLFQQDIQGSIAYARALKCAGVLNEAETTAIHEGLHKVLSEWQEGTFLILPGDEDIHTANERRLSEIVGTALGAKLHTGRSRNDQICTDTRMWVKVAASDLASLIQLIIETITVRAEENIDVIMPGYTHLQRAQPVRWSHWILSHAWSLRADRERLHDVVSHAMAEMPLGSGALAGTPLDINRAVLARDLNFTGVSLNSMHIVSDRDFVVEFVFWASLTSVHLSRFAEDLLIFCTSEFGMIQLDESLATGSSLMPHKRNPDGLELVRAKSAKISSQCTMLLSLLKGLPSTYNKDLQEDKSALFTSYDELKHSLKIMLATIQGLKVNPDMCFKSLSFDMLATDLAYYLVRKGMSFRTAHNVVGQVVNLAEKRKSSIDQLELAELQSISHLFEEDTLQIWNYEFSVEQYKTTGGTSRSNVLNQITCLRNISLQ